MIKGTLGMIALAVLAVGCSSPAPEATTTTGTPTDAVSSHAGVDTGKNITKNSVSLPPGGGNAYAPGSKAGGN